MLRNLADETYAFHNGVKIFALCVAAFFKVVEVNRRHIPRIGRSQRDISSTIVGMGLKHDPREVVEVFSEERRVGRKVATEETEERETEKIRNRTVRKRPLEGCQHSAAGDVRSRASARPRLSLRVPLGKLRPR